MAEQYVSRDDLYPLHKQYDLMGANKKIDLIYIQQLFHSLKLDDSKDKFKFFLDTKELQFSLDDLRRIFQLPQAIDNNNVGFVDALSFSQMLPF
ncbi:hypothetical protein Tco_1511667, partial [Tanacetum coccineum]